MSEAIKRQIAADIAAFKPQIKISSPIHAAALFKATLSEHPELLAYVSGYSSSVSPISGMCVRMSYCNTDVPLSSVFTVRSRDEIEDIIHRSISSFLSSVIIVAPKGVDVASVYSEFSVAYNGFYSNLVEQSYQSWTMESYGYTFFRLNFKYRIGKVKLIMMEREMKREIDRLKKILFCEGMRPETKAYIAHNYLARSVEYWLKENPDPLELSYRQSAYGALINKKCVCQGYSEAFKRLLDSQGIENYVLCGKVKGSAVHHAWNAVTFNGSDFYHVDVTWDSQGGGLSSHRYFCKTDAEMLPTRIWSRRPGVVCNSKTNIATIAKEDIFRNKDRYTRAGVDKKYF